MRKLIFILLLSLSSILVRAENSIVKNLSKAYEDHMRMQRWNTLADSAKTLEDNTIMYDPSYVKISYPDGDVPSNTGVCTDVVIRAFRKAFGADLQKEVHMFLKEMHPEIHTDTNIDHRRVRNLMLFFDTTYDVAKLHNEYPDKYLKGNIIIWDLGHGILHIGICVEDNMIIHNIGYGQVIDPISNVPGKIIRNYNYRPDHIKKMIEQYSE